VPKLNGIVESALSGAVGFDCDTKLSTNTAQAFYDNGFRFCLRYISLGGEEPSDLTYEEAAQILAAGLALMPVQHVPSEEWRPNASSGQTYGTNAATNADQVGFPVRVNVWCDLEGVVDGTPADDIIAYCKAWYDAVAAWGYTPGLYVGARCGLDACQLYDLPFQHYWKSGSTVPPVECGGKARGYQMIQSISDVYILDGVSYDRDTTETDLQGGTALWLIQQR